MEKQPTLKLKKTTKKVADVSTPKGLAYAIASYLSEKRALNNVIVDVSGATIIADYFVICSVRSITAVKALADHLDERMTKNHSTEPLRRDIGGKWAAIDYGSVIVHIFHEELREFYQLEHLWNNGENVTEYKD